MRELSKMSPKEYRDKYQFGSIQEGLHKITISKILDRIDSAQTVDDLKAILSDFITHTTGVK